MKTVRVGLVGSQFISTIHAEAIKRVPGAELFAVEREELRGRQIGDFLTPASRPVVMGLLDRLRSGSSRAVCKVQCDGGDSASQQMLVLARAAPSGRFLMLFLTATDLGEL